MLIKCTDSNDYCIVVIVDCCVIVTVICVVVCVNNVDITITKIHMIVRAKTLKDILQVENNEIFLESCQLLVDNFMFAVSEKGILVLELSSFHRLQEELYYLTCCSL